MKKSTWSAFGAGIVGAFAIGKVVAKKHEEDASIDDDNEYLYPLVKGEQKKREKARACLYTPTLYEKNVKPTLDIILSFAGLVLLSPLYSIVALAIKIDDPGPVFFTQKRVGKDKKFFYLHKFRTMKMSTPHDVPTHMLQNPEQYITRVGRILRKTSLDELPQIWDIWRGKMSVIGPRPALWNQDDLVAERDKYDANSILPGLTGLAQISGRDELEIDVKAVMDGTYTEALRRSSMSGLLMDIQCFLRTIVSVPRGDGVVEGGTETIHEREGEVYGEDGGQISSPFPLRAGVPEKDPEVDWGFKKTFEIDGSRAVKVLITGAGSYIGTSFEEYVKEHYPNISVTTVDMIDGSWREHDFSPYDVVFHVAGISHTDIGKADEATKEKYYAVNTDLAIEVAEKSKDSGVEQFIFMSSMIIYGGTGYVDEHTAPAPSNFYGDSKWQADKGVRSLATSTFHVAVLRPPMIYGRGCKGNYPILAKIAKETPVFPRIENKRSMLYIENLCEFVSLLTLSGRGGVFVPQNAEYSNTSSLVTMIADSHSKELQGLRILSPPVAIAERMPGRIGNLARKAFGNSCYDQRLSVYEGLYYQKTSLGESIRNTEGADTVSNIKSTRAPLHILVITQYFYPETFRINDMTTEWVKRGYKVTVLTGIPNYPMGRYFEGYSLTKKRREHWNGMEIIRIPLVARGNSSNKQFNSAGMVANYMSFLGSGLLWKITTDVHADIVFSYEVSPMTQVLIGCAYAKKHHIPHFAYIQDLWPENVETMTGIHSKAVIGPINRMVDKIYRETDEIFVTSPSFVKSVVRRGVDRAKVHYWPQYAEEFYRPLARTEIDRTLFPYSLLPDDGSFKIAFTGNIGTAQGLEILPEAAEMLKDSNAPSVRFIIIGDGRCQEKLEQEIKDRKVSNFFTMIPRQPSENIPGLLSLCDAAFLSFNQDRLWEMTVPAKLQSYMACGMIIIASAAGEIERVIKEAGCGICSRTGDSKALEKGIQKLLCADDEKLEQMRQNSREYCEKHFSKKHLMDQMDEYISA